MGDLDGLGCSYRGELINGYHCANNKYPPFGARDLIHLTVDCIAGALTVSVNNGTSYVIHGDIYEFYGEGPAFRLALSLDRNVQVRLKEVRWKLSKNDDFEPQPVG